MCLLETNKEGMKAFEKECKEINSKLPKIKIQVIGEVDEETKKSNPYFL